MAVMRVGWFGSVCALVACSALAPAAAIAQSSPIGGGGPYVELPVPPRIEINPRPAFRRCASWYVIQNRPSGRVLYPEKHCWWQR